MLRGAGPFSYENLETFNFDEGQKYGSLTFLSAFNHHGLRHRRVQILTIHLRVCVKAGMNAFSWACPGTYTHRCLSVI